MGVSVFRPLQAADVRVKAVVYKCLLHLFAMQEVKVCAKELALECIISVNHKSLILFNGLFCAVDWLDLVPIVERSLGLLLNFLNPYKWSVPYQIEVNLVNYAGVRCWVFGCRGVALVKAAHKCALPFLND